MDFKFNHEITSDLLMKNMNIYCFCNCRLDSRWKAENARANFTRIYFILGGYGELYVGGKTVPLTPYNIYIVPSGLDFGYYCPDYLEKIYVHLSVPTESRFDVFYGISDVAVFKNRRAQTEKILKFGKSSEQLSGFEAQALILSVILEGLRFFGITEPFSKIYSLLVKNAMDYVDSRLRSGLTVREIADCLFVSESKLNKVFKAETGSTPGQYIINRLLWESENLLLNSELSLSQISDKLGFCDQFYFSRIFSKHYGVSPKKYRKQAVGNAF